MEVVQLNRNRTAYTELVAEFASGVAAGCIQAGRVAFLRVFYHAVSTHGFVADRVVQAGFILTTFVLRARGIARILTGVLRLVADVVGTVIFVRAGIPGLDALIVFLVTGLGSVAVFAIVLASIRTGLAARFRVTSLVPVAPRAIVTQSVIRGILAPACNTGVHCATHAVVATGRGLRLLVDGAVAIVVYAVTDFGCPLIDAFCAGRAFHRAAGETRFGCADRGVVLRVVVTVQQIWDGTQVEE
jgi:hypothetical protein